MSVVNLDENGSRIHLVLLTMLFIRMKLECQLFICFANLVQTGTFSHANDFVMALVVMVLFRRHHVACRCLSMKGGRWRNWEWMKWAMQTKLQWVKSWKTGDFYPVRWIYTRTSLANDAMMSSDWWSVAARESDGDHGSCSIDSIRKRLSTGFNSVM